MSSCESFSSIFARCSSQETQDYIGHILDGWWESHRCLSVLHMTICYQNEFEEAPKLCTSKSVKLLYSVNLTVAVKGTGTASRIPLLCFFLLEDRESCNFFLKL